MQTRAAAIGGTAYLIYGGNGFTSSVTHLGTSSADTVTGTSAANVMIGGRGNDILLGNGGADVLTGREGDFVITWVNTFTSDTSITGLTDLRTAWTSANSYGTCIVNLRAGVGASNASLKAAMNVLNDSGEDDILTGGAGTDWFLAALDDVITDFFPAKCWTCCKGSGALKQVAVPVQWAAHPCDSHRSTTIPQRATA